LTKAWHDLYEKGEQLNRVAKRFFTEFKKAEVEGDNELMLIWSESFRKITMNIVSIACTVLKVEEIVKGKVRSYE